MAASELVLEILVNLGFMARNESGSWAIVEEEVNPSQDVRNQQWGLLKTLLREAPHECDALILGLYCGADRGVGLQRMYENRATFGNLIPDQDTIMVRLGSDAIMQQEQPVRVPFLPRPENALWMTPFNWVLQNFASISFLYAGHQLSMSRDIDAFAGLYADHIASEQGPNDSIEACLHISYGRWEEALSVYARMARTHALLEGEKLLQAVAAAGMKHFGSARELITEIDTSQLGESSIRLLRVLEVMVLEVQASDEYTQAQAQAAREKVRVTEADSPQVLSLLAQPKLHLPRGTTEDIDLREDLADPWSRLRDDERKRQAAFQDAMSQIDSLVGLEDLRGHIQSFVKQLRITQAREEQGLATHGSTGHWVFAGPPGTGKTTVARIMAKLLFGLGKIDSDKVVEVRRADLVGQHLGETAPRTRRKVEEAIDGVLFIDEAYELQNNEGYNGSDAFGREAVAELLAMMENERERLVVIAAGYPDEMQRFLSANEGLRSRFNQQLEFTTYSPTELTEIVARMADADDNHITETAQAWLESSFRQFEPTTINTRGNGRLSRDVYHLLLRNRDTRLNDDMDDAAARGAWTRDELTTLTDADARAAILDAGLFFPPAQEAPPRTCIDVRDKMSPLATALVPAIINDINSLRTDAGLHPLEHDGDLERVAQFWLHDQILDFSRNPNTPFRFEPMELPEHISNCTNIYESVEVGSDVETYDAEHLSEALRDRLLQGSFGESATAADPTRIGLGITIYGPHVLMVGIFGQAEDAEMTDSPSYNNGHGAREIQEGAANELESIPALNPGDSRKAPLELGDDKVTLEEDVDALFPG